MASKYPVAYKAKTRAENAPRENPGRSDRPGSQRPRPANDNPPRPANDNVRVGKLPQKVGSILARGNPLIAAALNAPAPERGWEEIPDILRGEVPDPLELEAGFGEQKQVSLGILHQPDWTLVCQQTAACYTGCSGQRTPIAHYWPSNAVQPCINWCSQSVGTGPISHLNSSKDKVHMVPWQTVVLGRQRGDGCPGTGGPTRFHSTQTWTRPTNEQPTYLPFQIGDATVNRPARDPVPAHETQPFPSTEPALVPQPLPDRLPEAEPSAPPRPGRPQRMPSPRQAPIPIGDPGIFSEMNGPRAQFDVPPQGPARDPRVEWNVNVREEWRPRRDRRRERSKKVRMTRAGRIIWGWVNTASEGLDLLNALFDALPYDKQFAAFREVANPYYDPDRAKPWDQPGWDWTKEQVVDQWFDDYFRKGGHDYWNETTWKTDPYSKARTVYDNFDDSYPLAEAMVNFVNNQIEDFYFGKQGQLAGAASGRVNQASGLEGATQIGADLLYDYSRESLPIPQFELQDGYVDLTWGDSSWSIGKPN